MIRAMQKTSLIDYPGKIVSTIFFDGCNFRCPFCHNKYLVLPELITQDSTRITKEEVLKHLLDTRDFLDGICITGGEPTLSPDLYDFIKEVKENNFLVKLDTNGTNPELLSKLFKDNLLDYVAMDIKGPFNKYSEISGVNVDISKIKKSIKLIKNSNIEYEFRTTLMPKLFSKEDILETVRQLEGCKLFSLQQFKPGETLSDSFKEEEIFQRDFLLSVKDEILSKKLSDNCIVRAK